MRAPNSLAFPRSSKISWPGRLRSPDRGHLLRLHPKATAIKGIWVNRNTTRATIPHRKRATNSPDTLHRQPPPTEDTMPKNLLDRSGYPLLRRLRISLTMFSKPAGSFSWSIGRRIRLNLPRHTFIIGIIWNFFKLEVDKSRSVFATPAFAQIGRCFISQPTYVKKYLVFLPTANILLFINRRYLLFNAVLCVLCLFHPFLSFCIRICNVGHLLRVLSF